MRLEIRNATGAAFDVIVTEFYSDDPLWHARSVIFYPDEPARRVELGPWTLTGRFEEPSRAVDPPPRSGDPQAEGYVPDWAEPLE